MYAHFRHGRSVDYGQAVHWYHLAAEQGHKMAQYKLGALYHHGEGMMPQDYGKAARWSNLGHQYQVGQGVPKNYIQALMWYKLAVELGQKDAEIERDLLARLMTPAQVAEAQRLASEWFAQHLK